MDPAQLSWQTLLIGGLASLSAALAWRLQGRRQPEPHNGDPLPTARMTGCPAGKVLVKDIMSRDLVTLAPEDNGQRAWRRLQEHKVKTLPVVRDGQVVGIIALVDFLKHLGLAWHTLPEDLTHRANIVMDQDVETLMSKPARTVPIDMPLTELAPLLSDTGLRHLPVVNSAGHLVGIVTQSDVIAGLAHLLTLKPPSE